MKRDADVTETRRTASPSMWETVNRVVFPVKDQDLTLPLYAIEWTRPHLPEQVFNPPIDLKRLNLSKQSLTGFQRMVDDGITRHADTDSNDVFTVGSRRSITVKAGHRVSLCTFFNAFPASYWRRWTNVGSIRLSLKAQGKGSVIVFKSNGRGLFSPSRRWASTPPPASLESRRSCRSKGSSTADTIGSTSRPTTMPR